ncbi:MAG: T9SS type A sorting domain-containing protein [Ignavibacteria bacterium]
MYRDRIQGPITATAIVRSSYNIASGAYQPRLYYKINNGSFNYVNPSYSNLDTFKFNIPGQAINTSVNYYIAVQDAEGTIVSTLPAGGSGVNPPGTIAPSEMFQYQVANIYIATIGTGSVSSNFPFATYYMDAKTQYLYLAPEIGNEASNLIQIGFDVISTDPGPMNNFSVKFQNTSITSLSGFVTSGWTTCFSPSSYTVPGSGWQNIVLTQPFEYTGGNLLVEICYDNSSYTQYSTVKSTPASGMYWGRYGDLSSASGCETNSWTSSTSPPGRANTRLTFSPLTSISGNNNILPGSFELRQNYPNPFNPVTKIRYSVPKNEFVSIKIYDMLGKETATLVSKTVEAGEYIYDFDGSSLSSGSYICRMNAGEFKKEILMVLLK